MRKHALHFFTPLHTRIQLVYGAYAKSVPLMVRTLWKNIKGIRGCDALCSAKHARHSRDTSRNTFVLRSRFPLVAALTANLLQQILAPKTAKLLSVLRSAPEENCIGFRPSKNTKTKSELQQKICNRENDTLYLFPFFLCFNFWKRSYNKKQKKILFQKFQCDKYTIYRLYNSSKTNQFLTYRFYIKRQIQQNTFYRKIQIQYLKKNIKNKSVKNKNKKNTIQKSSEIINKFWNKTWKKYKTKIEKQ